MEESGHSQELQNPNMELKAYLLDWRLKEMEKIWITLKLQYRGQTRLVYLMNQIRSVQVEANSNFYSKAVGVYDGAYSYVNTYVNTEQALNQGKTEAALGK